MKQNKNFIAQRSQRSLRALPLTLILCVLGGLGASNLRAQNVKVVNPDSSPAAVKVISGSLGFGNRNSVGAPGATPSPSPIGAVAVQGAIPGTDIPVTVRPNGTPFPITATTPIPVTATTPVPVKIDQTTAGLTNATQPKQYTGTPSNFTVGTTDATVFTLAAGEVGWIQNLDDVTLNVKRGASASTSSFNHVLKAASASDAGDGGVIKIDDWIGAVSVAASTGSPRYIAFKVAP